VDMDIALLPDLVWMVAAVVTGRVLLATHLVHLVDVAALTGKSSPCNASTIH